MLSCTAEYHDWVWRIVDPARIKIVQKPVIIQLCVTVEPLYRNFFITKTPVIHIAKINNIKMNRTVIISYYWCYYQLLLISYNKCSNLKIKTQLLSLFQMPDNQTCNICCPDEHFNRAFHSFVKLRLFYWPFKNIFPL